MDDPDGARLSDVFLANRERLRAFLRARCRDDAIDDLLQEVWIRTISVSELIEPSPLSYPFRMADRLVVDRHRSAHRRLQREADWTAVHQPTDLLSPSAEDRLIGREHVTALLAALDQLGPRIARVFRRYRLDGSSQRDIAAELGISLRTVEKDLQKAYALLRQLQEQHDAV